MKKMNQRFIAKAMLLASLCSAVPMQASAYTHSANQSQAEDQKILEMPLEFLFPMSLTELRMFKKADFKSQMRKYAQDLVDGANGINKKSNIRAQYVVHSVRFLDDTESNDYGIGNAGKCDHTGNLDLLRGKRGLYGSIEYQQGANKIAGTVLLCNYLSSSVVGYAHRGVWDKHPNHSTISLDATRGAGAYRTLAHELGHAWGLYHVADELGNKHRSHHFTYHGEVRHELIMQAYGNDNNKNFGAEEINFINQRIDKIIGQNGRGLRVLDANRHNSQDDTFNNNSSSGHNNHFDQGNTYDKEQRLFSGSALLDSGLNETYSGKEIHLHVSRSYGKRMSKLALNFGLSVKYGFEFVNVTNLVHYDKKQNHQFKNALYKNIFKTRVYDRAGEISFDLEFKFTNERTTYKRKVIIHVED
jgi:hypothetical protein